MGARLFARGRDGARKVGFLVRAGNDFPGEVAANLQEWQTTLDIRAEPSAPSTRGLLIYEDTAFGREIRVAVGRVLCVDDQQKRHSNTRPSPSKPVRICWPTPRFWLPRAFTSSPTRILSRSRSLGFSCFARKRASRPVRTLCGSRFRRRAQSRIRRRICERPGSWTAFRPTTSNSCGFSSKPRQPRQEILTDENSRRSAIPFFAEVLGPRRMGASLSEPANMDALSFFRTSKNAGFRCIMTLTTLL